MTDCIVLNLFCDLSVLFILAIIFGSDYIICDYYIISFEISTDSDSKFNEYIRFRTVIKG